MSIEEEIKQIINERMLTADAYFKSKTDKFCKKIDDRLEELRLIDYNTFLNETKKLVENTKDMQKEITALKEEIEFIKSFAESLRVALDSF